MSLSSQRCSYCKKPFTPPDSGAQISTCAKSTCLTETVMDYWNAYGVRAVITNDNNGPRLVELWKGDSLILPGTLLTTPRALPRDA